jgi:hypothetical protein
MAIAVDTTALDVGGAYKSQRSLTRRPGKIAVPLLTLLADVNGVEQVGGRVPTVDIIGGAEVRDWQALDRGLRQE